MPGTGGSSRGRSRKRRTVTWGSQAAALPLVDAEALETELHALGEGRRSAARIVEDEHADRARLAVAHGLQ